MKIFNLILSSKKNEKIIPFNQRKADTGNIKYFPAFSKEWKNTTYSYDKEKLKNLPVETYDLNKLIKAYFNLYFKNQTFLRSLKKRYLRNKRILLKKRRYALRKIFISEAEIKHTANKAVITIYTFNQERIISSELYKMVNNEVKLNLLEKFVTYYTQNIQTLYSFFGADTRKKSNFHEKSSGHNKNLFLLNKYKLFKKFLQVKNLYSKRILSIFIFKYKESSLELLRRYELNYMLNENKFNKFTLLSKLSKLGGDILNKKIEFNIINLKSISYNPDLFIQALTLKLRKRKKIRIHAILSSLLDNTKLPSVNSIKERRSLKKEKNLGIFTNRFKDLKIISMLQSLAGQPPLCSKSRAYLQTNLKTGKVLDSFAVPATKSLDNLLNIMQNNTSKAGVTSIPLARKNNIHKFIFNSIDYKNLGGMRLKLDGRLTKRYRADRSVHLLKWKGGLKNINSSFRGLSSVLFRGNINSNNAYAWSKGKRRVGSFAIKGWIGGK